MELWTKEFYFLLSTRFLHTATERETVVKRLSTLSVVLETDQDCPRKRLSNHLPSLGEGETRSIQSRRFGRRIETDDHFLKICHARKTTLLSLFFHIKRRMMNTVPTGANRSGVGNGFSQNSYASNSNPPAGPAATTNPTIMVTPEPDLDQWQNMTRTLAHYERLEQIGEGTYGQVYRARCHDSGRIVAMKKMRIHHGGYWGMPLQLIREIKILKRLHHPRLLSMIEVVTSKGVEYMDADDPPMKRASESDKNSTEDSRESYKGNLFLVLEYVEHDLTGLLDVAYQFTEVQIKCIFKQLLEALAFMHENKYVHRDIKSSNILLNSSFGLKLADFGLARCIEPSILEQMKSSSNDRSTSSTSAEFTNKVITLWYRPPEILLGACQYGPAVDVWSAGCILAELILGKPLFAGKTELEQLNLVLDMLGTPNEETWEYFARMKKAKPNSSSSSSPLDLSTIRHGTPNKRSRLRDKYGEKIGGPALNLVEKLLEWDPRKRMTAANALNNSYFWKAPVAPDDPSTLGRLEVGPDGHFHEFQTKKKRKEAKAAAEKIRSEAIDRGLTKEEAKEEYDKAYASIIKKVAQEGVSTIDSNKKHGETDLSKSNDAPGISEEKNPSVKNDRSEQDVRYSSERDNARSERRAGRDSDDRDERRERRRSRERGEDRRERRKNRDRDDRRSESRRSRDRNDGREEGDRKDRSRRHRDHDDRRHRERDSKRRRGHEDKERGDSRGRKVLEQEVDMINQPPAQENPPSNDLDTSTRPQDSVGGELRLTATEARDPTESVPSAGELPAKTNTTEPNGAAVDVSNPDSFDGNHHSELEVGHRGDSRSHGGNRRDDHRRSRDKRDRRGDRRDRDSRNKRNERHRSRSRDRNDPPEGPRWGEDDFRGPHRGGDDFRINSRGGEEFRGARRDRDDFWASGRGRGGPRGDNFRGPPRGDDSRGNSRNMPPVMDREDENRRYRDQRQQSPQGPYGPMDGRARRGDDRDYCSQPRDRDRRDFRGRNRSPPRSRDRRF